MKYTIYLFNEIQSNYSCWTISSLITVSWKAQVSSAVGTICSAGSRNLNSRVVRVFWNTLYIVQGVHVPVEPGVPELHAGGEPDAHLAVRPVRGAPAGDVQHARDTTNLYSTVQQYKGNQDQDFE